MLAVLTSLSFLLGAACSSVAGYVGMWVSVRANVRVAGAARRSAREALVVALRAGGFSGLIVVGLVSRAWGLESGCWGCGLAQLLPSAFSPGASVLIAGAASL